MPRKFTIMYPSMDCSRDYSAMVDDANKVLFFPSAQEAYDHYTKEYWHDSTSFFVVEFHDYKIKLEEEI